MGSLQLHTTPTVADSTSTLLRLSSSTTSYSTMMKFVLLSVILASLLLTDVECYRYQYPQQHYGGMSSYWPLLLQQQGGANNNNLLMMMMGGMGGMGGGMQSMLPYLLMNQGTGGLNQNNLLLSMMGGMGGGMQNPMMAYYLLNQHNHAGYAAAGHTHTP